jgi:hypothetical protein
VLVQLSPPDDDVDPVVVGMKRSLGSFDRHLVQRPDRDTGPDFIPDRH